MKKMVLKKLQSLTAIVVLNSIPVSFADTLEGANAIDPQVRMLVDKDGKSSLHDGSSQEASLEQLYLQNSLAYIQRHSQPVTSPSQRQYQIALALLEEAYQDDYDSLLDQYEYVVSQETTLSHSASLLNDKSLFEKELMKLKESKRQKIEEFRRQFGIV